MIWFSSPDQMDYLQHTQTDYEQQDQIGKKRDVVVGGSKQIQQQQPSCSVCKSEKIITDPESAEIICSSCGMVISDKLEEINRPERRIFNEDTDNDKTSRTGAPTSIAYPDMGLSTVITKTHRDAEGQKNSYTHTLFNAKVKDM
jgi:hypothetical protein